MKFNSSPFRLPSLATAVVAAFALASCDRAPKKAATSQPVPVQVAEAQRRDVPITAIAIGTVQAVRSVAVKSQVDGVIAGIAFNEGDEVNAGDLLVSLDRRPFENSLRSAEAALVNLKAQLSQAEADAQRYEHLDQQSVVSKEEVLQYQTKAESGRAAVQAQEALVLNARLQLSYTEIRAPISGRTGQLGLHQGALVKANDATQSIVTINQLAPISVAYSIPEFVLGSVRESIARGEVRVRLVPHSGGDDSAPIEGRLQFIDNSVDPTTGTIVLKALVENADRKLWPGEFVDVTTYVGVEKDRVVVPSAAVQAGQHGSQVFVINKDKKADLRPVRVGRTLGGDTVILAGLEGGEQVVTDGQLRLTPGVKTEIRPLGGAGEELARSASDEPDNQKASTPKS